MEDLRETTPNYSRPMLAESNRGSVAKNTNPK